MRSNDPQRTALPALKHSPATTMPAEDARAARPSSPGGPRTGPRSALKNLTAPPEMSSPPEGPPARPPHGADAVGFDGGDQGFRKLVEHSWDTFAVMATDTTLVWVSAGVRELLGYEPQDLVGRSAFDLIHPDERERAASELASTMGTGLARPAAFFRTRHIDGSWRDVAVTSADRSQDPDLRGVVLNIRDVTDQVAAEEALRTSERRFRSLAASSPIGIFQLDASGNCTYVNERWQEITGRSEAEASDHGWRCLIDQQTDEELRRHRNDFTSRVTQLRVRLVRPDGATSWAVVCTAPLVDEKGSTVGIVGTLDDVTELVEAQSGTRQLTNLLESTSDIVAIADPRRGFTYLNRSARRMFGMDDSDDPAQFKLLEHVPGWVQEMWEHEIVDALKDEGLWSGELALTSADGETLPVSTVLMTHFDTNGHIESLSGIVRDVSERKVFEARLEHQATHDPLTGLPNRTLLLDRVEVALGRAHRNRRTAALLFLDLDHFKVVNDSLGHGLGDRLLVAVAERLSSAVRPGDTVARFGGDEFVVLCEDLASEEEGREVASRVLAEVGAPIGFDDTEVFVTASIGMAFASRSTRTADELLRDADAAMYQAKRRGRSRTEVFDAGMRVRAVDRLDLENALRRAIDRHELRVLYQPQIDLVSGRIIGAEALLRWEHPERGLLAPGDFLAIAEETGLIVPIGAWVLAQACRAVQRIAAELPDRPPLFACVNVAARQLAHPGLAEEVQAALQATGIDPSLINLEITEDVLMDDVAITQAALCRLKALGVDLAVDDFGTGYSSLSYLRRFPVDLLKVDRAFVDGLGRNPEDSAIVAAVVNLAQTLGLRAMAEGVETADQLAELRTLGCDMAQGFFMARPLTDAALLDLLATEPTW